MPTIYQVLVLTWCGGVRTVDFQQEGWCGMGAGPVANGLATSGGHRPWRAENRGPDVATMLGVVLLVVCLALWPAVARGQASPDPADASAAPAPQVATAAPAPEAAAPAPAPDPAPSTSRPKATVPARTPHVSSPAPSTAPPTSPAPAASAPRSWRPAPVSHAPAAIARSTVRAPASVRRSSRASSHKRSLTRRRTRRHHVVESAAPARRHHVVDSAAPSRTSLVKPLMRAIGFLPLARPRAESSRVAASEIGVAGLSLLLLAVAGCVLLVMAARFDRGRLGG